MFNPDAVKTDAELTHAELAERTARRAATRAQILADQASNAKRDAKALAAERRWFARQAKEQGK